MRLAVSSVVLLLLGAGCSETPGSMGPDAGGSGAAGASGGASSSGGSGGARSTGGRPGGGGGGAVTASGGTASGGLSSSGGSAATGGSRDSGAGEGPDGAPPTWLSRTVAGRGSGKIVEKVTYASDGLRIEGQVCRPDDDAPHALIMVNHGGFEGNGDEAFTGNLDADSFCLNGARLGFVIAESSYRGEDGSEGNVEVCLGEVNDVAAMLEILRHEPYVDPSRVGAFGGSHGGCITTSLAIREPTLRAAVDFCGPSDLSVLTRWWHDQLDQNEPAPYCAPVLGTSPCTVVHQTLIGVAEGATGGPVSPSTEAAYRARSPVHRLGELKVPMAFFQGTDDYLVNVDQVCKKREALTAAGAPPLAWYLDGSLTPRSPAAVCGGNFRTNPVPDTASTAAWSGDGPYLFVYEGQGHALTGAANTQATTIALRFLFAHLE
jgi:alpha/beta superfamily hydrolase